MNINKYLAQKQYGSRRGEEDLIIKKKVRINGKIAILGNRVNENDKVEVDSQAVTNLTKKYVYYAYYKPRGIITHSPKDNETDIKENLADLIEKDVSPVGRLDKDSEGLIILTNDGRITDRLLNPKFSHEKEYIVETKMKLRNNFKAKMEAGVKIEKEITAPCKVEIIGDRKFRIRLTEGKKHQIRRMCVALFNEVHSLKRVRIMNIKIEKLKAGQFRKITGAELAAFLKELGM